MLSLRVSAASIMLIFKCVYVNKIVLIFFTLKKMATQHYKKKGYTAFVKEKKNIVKYKKKKLCLRKHVIAATLIDTIN
jgi:hypothetical protein